MEARKDYLLLAGSGKVDINISSASNEASSRSHMLEVREGTTPVRASASTILDKVQTSIVTNVKGHSFSSQPQVALPDLNVRGVALLPSRSQPFNDSQQVQLRAQILVYGSLIQGSLPEEALMDAAFADIKKAARQEAKRNVGTGGRRSWEKAWHTAAERMRNGFSMNASREPLLLDTGFQKALSSLSKKASEESGQANGLLANVSVEVGACTVDSRNLSVLNASLPEAPGFKSHSHSAKPTNAAASGSVDNRSNAVSSFNSPCLPSISTSTWPARSMLIQSMGNSPAGRSFQVDVQQLRTSFFPTLQPGSVVPGSAHWLSPSLFPGAWAPSSQALGFDSSAPFAPVQTNRAPEMNVHRITVSPQVPLVPVMPVAPPFTSPSIRPSKVLENATTEVGVLQKSNVVPGGQAATESKARKTKKIHSETIMPATAVVSGGLTISSPQLVSVISGSTSAAPNLSQGCLASCQPVTFKEYGSSMHSSDAQDSLAMVKATTQVSGPVVETQALKPLTTQASAVVGIFGNLTSQSETSSAIEHGARSVLSDNVMNHLEQAKTSAEEASSLAASSVKHSELLWNRLQGQRSAGLICNKENRLASLAIAIAAAASAAKAAAAAAEVAYEAALQAKLIREEALASPEDLNDSQSSRARLDQGEAMHSQSSCVGHQVDINSIVTRQMPTTCDSIITRSREIAKNSPEATYAATKRVQNLNSVVQAAELAAVAISHAGAIATMSEPISFTLDMLLKAGPEGFHKLQNMELPGQPQGNDNENQQGNENNGSAKGEKAVKGKGLELSITGVKRKVGELKESGSQEAVEYRNQMLEPETIVVLDHLKNRKAFTGIELRDSETEKDREDAGVNQPEDAGPPGCLPQNEEAIVVEAELRDTSKTNSEQILKGSLVEVLSTKEGLCRMWFTGIVLNVENRKALVLYDTLLSNNGPAQLEEWVDLEGPSSEAPGIRLAHPITRVNFEGTKKRRRTYMGNYVWSVKDRVDAWIRNGWLEGVVLEKSADNESKVKVFLPGEGHTASFVKSWNLRPSLIWKDGHWVSWTELKSESILPQNIGNAIQNETPVSKRQKVAQEKHETLSKSIDKNNKPRSERMPRSTVRMLSNEEIEPENAAKMADYKKEPAKEGTKAVVGIPKLNENRKYTEVSKHDTPIRLAQNTFEGNTRGINAKLSEIHMVFAGGSRDDDGMITNKLSLKQSQQKARLGNGSVERIQSKSIFSRSDKEKSFTGSGLDARREASGQDTMESGLSLSKSDGLKLGKRNLLSEGHQSDVHIVSGSAPKIISKDAALHKQQSSRRGLLMSDEVAHDKQSLRSTKGEQLSNLSEDHGEEKKLANSATKILEPRRSTRRFQPTSKLLEGLQSTPKLGKIVTSEEKGSRIPVEN